MNFRVSMNQSSFTSPLKIYSGGNKNEIPKVLSVDWLNNKLYILFESYLLVKIGLLEV